MRIKNEKEKNIINKNNILLTNKEILVKSKERVKELAEVFTSKKEVNSMINMIPKEVWENEKSTFLEPACGDGNFIEQILSKKLDNIKIPRGLKKNQTNIEFKILCTVSTVYGIDICEENIYRCKERMEMLVKNYYSNNLNTLNYSNNFINKLKEILNSNLIQGDTLNEKDKIVIVQWDTPLDYYFRKKVYFLKELEKENPKPFKIYNMELFN